MHITDAIRHLLGSDSFWSTMDPRTEINAGNCEDFMSDVCQLVPGAEEQTTGADARIGHYWIEVDGRHYDAECPEGVDCPEALPIFVRATYVGK